ncbi:hypothetical protein C4K31_3376 [Pseudomonas chlororaphis subsp. piscium]|nr:hypothetical protein C4K31_3376 [Pseudomonas chlororaphis subsp. piscium]
MIDKRDGETKKPQPSQEWFPQTAPLKTPKDGSGKKVKG